MKIVCLVENYPRNDDVSEGFFVHNRNKYLKKQGKKVEVVSFSCEKTYFFDGIKVMCLKDYKKELKTTNKDDILVCHAANIRHHYLFLRKYKSKYKKIVMYFHGHEILKTNLVYSKPYFYMKKNKGEKIAQDIYDSLKIKIWSKFIKTNINKLFIFFVSNWMHEKFLYFTKLKEEDILGNYSITYNAIGEFFEINKYDNSTEKKYDFITVRGNLDNSKYGVDIVNELAKKNPDKRFLLIGKGDFFKYFKKSENLEWVNSVLDHKTIMCYLNLAKYALMPTRTDAQGVMACEMASTGIPLITSDISVCHEIFGEFKNVKYIDNKRLGLLDKDFLTFPEYKINEKYFAKYTNYKEKLIFDSLVK